MPRTSTTPHREILEAALQGLEAQKQRLEEQIGQVRSLLGSRGGRAVRSTSAASAAAAGSRPKRVLSAEARRRIAAAQKKRWAAYRKNAG